MTEPGTANTPEAAWQAFKYGRLSKALAISNAVLKAGKANHNQLPLAEVWTMRAYHRARTGSHREAYALLRRALGHYPEDRIAQQMMLIVEDNMIKVASNAENPTPAPRNGANGRIVLGIGTGRSGSTTLSELLAAQHGARITHEQPPILYWDRRTSADDFHIQRFWQLSNRFPLVGDAAHWWLPKLNGIIRSIPEVRVVALKRDKRQTVNSFLRIKGGRGRGAINHWVPHTGSYWRNNIWDPCYPKYFVTTLEEALNLYWDNYYEEVDRLMEKHPKNIRVFSTEHLSDPSIQKKILSFVEIDDKYQVLVPGLRKNRGTVSDGVKML